MFPIITIMKIDIFKSASCFKNIVPKDDNNREINVYKFDDVQVTGKNLFYPNMLLKTRDQLILPLLEKTMSLKIETIYQTQNMEYEYHEADFTRVINEPLFFFVYNTDNYYHFIYDTLPYLISYLFSCSNAFSANWSLPAASEPFGTL